VQALEGDIDSSHIDFVHRQALARYQAARHVPPGQAAAARGAAHRLRRVLLGPAALGRGGPVLAPHHPVHPAVLLDDRGERSPTSSPRGPGFRSTITTISSFVMRARLDRPVTEEEARQVRDPFASWGGYVESGGDPAPPLLHGGQHPQRLPAGLRAAEGADPRHPVPRQPARPGHDRDDGDDLRPDAGAPGHHRRHGDPRAAPPHRGPPGPCGTRARCPPTSTTRISAGCGRPPRSCPTAASWISATEKARQSDAGVPIAWVPFV